MDQAAVTLEAVVVAVTDDRPRILTVNADSAARLPSGGLVADRDTTLGLGMRRIIDQETGLEVEYLEQLYTFGDLNRATRPPDGQPRTLGVGYLVLTREAGTSAQWSDWYHLFPWEDHRATSTDDALVAALQAWAAGDAQRLQRIQVAFGLGTTPWDGVRALDRYELLYEARMVQEWYVDHRRAPTTTVWGTHLAQDHRRVAATALSRLRGKLTYRPLVFDLMPRTFTLSHLQRTVEAVVGQPQHTQNFRRMVDRTGLVEGTGQLATTGGRPAELFRFRPEAVTERPQVGLLG